MFSFKNKLRVELVQKISQDEFSSDKVKQIALIKGLTFFLKYHRIKSNTCKFFFAYFNFKQVSHTSRSFQRVECTSSFD